MNSNELNPAAIRLRKGEIHRLEGAFGRRIEAVRGSLWITIDGDRRDIIVGPGEGVCFDRDGATLVSALDDACFLLLEPLPARRVSRSAPRATGAGL